MSGIICCCGSELITSQSQFEELVSSMFIGRQSHRVMGNGDFIYTSVVAAPGSCASKAVCHETGITIYVDGYFAETLVQKSTSAEWFLQTYKERKESCFGELNGSYNILIVENTSKSITLVTDRYGTRPLLYSFDNGAFAISYSSELLVRLGVINKTLNENLVANAVSYSRVWHGDETFYEGVKSIQAGTVLKWSAVSGVRINKFAVKRLYNDEKPSIKKLAALFREVIGDFQRIPNLGISLSGGLDSRILLAAGFKGPAYTWGYRQENDEIELAKQCAEQASIPWKFLQLKPEDFLDLDCVGDVLREGLDIFVQSYSLKCYQKIADSGVVGLMTGLALDFTLAGSYSPPLLKEQSSQETIHYAFSKIESFSPELRKRLIKSDPLNDTIAAITDQIGNDLATLYNEHGAVGALQLFFMEHRVRRVIFQRQLWQRAFLEDYIPTFDNRLVDYIELFSLEERKNHKIFRELLIELDLDLADIPYQGTNLPASAPVEYWAEATRIEQHKEVLTRKIFHESNGKCYIPYNRYYSNFDEWFRVNEQWKSETQRLLLSEDSKVLQFLDKAVLQEILCEQLNASNAHYGRLVILISLEKTLRWFARSNWCNEFYGR